jgi:hypothetical protein
MNEYGQSSLEESLSSSPDSSLSDDDDELELLDDDEVLLLDVLDELELKNESSEGSSLPKALRSFTS